MSNTNPLVAQLIKLLPFLGRNVCYSDRELAMKRFRRMLAEQPNAFLDAYDAAIAEIRKIYPHESADLIDSAALSELEDQAVAETKATAQRSPFMQRAFLPTDWKISRSRVSCLNPKTAKSFANCFTANILTNPMLRFASMSISFRSIT